MPAQQGIVGPVLAERPGRVEVVVMAGVGVEIGLADLATRTVGLQDTVAAEAHSADHRLVGVVPAPGSLMDPVLVDYLSAAYVLFNHNRV